MSSPLTKGYTYLAITTDVNGRKGWIIQQTGQRSWVATQFTECVIKADGEYNVILGNSIKCWEELKKRSYSEEIIWNKFMNNGDLRRAMFNVLQYGHFRKHEEV